MKPGAGILTVMLLVTLATGAETEPTSQAPRQDSGQAPRQDSGQALRQGLGQAARMLPDIESPAQVGNTLKWVAVVTVLSLAPALLVLVTSFTRIVVVLGLLRQALATHQLPPNQIMFGLALLMTVVVMAPVYTQIHSEAISPYLAGELGTADAVAAGETHIRAFIIRQIEGGGNVDDVYLFLSDEIATKDQLTWRDVPTLSLVPAFVISELKIAFLMGFRIFLPFLVIDMLIASVLVSMGMLMLPPVLISLPFKLLLFVLADGWHLVVGTLMSSFG